MVLDEADESRIAIHDNSSNRASDCEGNGYQTAAVHRIPRREHDDLDAGDMHILSTEDTEILSSRKLERPISRLCSLSIPTELENQTQRPHNS